MHRVRNFPKRFLRIQRYNTQPNETKTTIPNPRIEEQRKSLKMLFQKPGNAGMEEDEEDIVEVTEENQKLARNIGTHALGYATLINIFAAILFVLWMRFYYGFTTIHEFKVALYKKVYKFKGFVLPYITSVQTLGKEFVDVIDVKGKLGNEPFIPPPMEQNDVSEPLNKMASLFQKKNQKDV